MSHLVRCIARHILGSPSRWATVLVLIAIGIAVYVGTYTGINRIEDTTSQLYEQLGLFDWNFRIKRAELRSLPSADALAELDGVAAAQWRARFPGVATLQDGTSVGAVVVAVDPSRRPAVGDVLLTQGEFLTPDARNAVIVDETFARDNALMIGDTLDVIALDASSTVTVRGIGVFPEYLVASVDEHMTLPIRGSLVAILASQDVVTEHLDQNPANLLVGPVVNDLVVRLDPDADHATSRAAIEKALARERVLEVTAGTRQYSVLCHQNRLWVFRDFLPAVIAIFEAMAAIVLLLAMHQLAASWRKEAGTLLAFGVPRGRIIAAWSVVLVGMVALGVGIGTILSIPGADMVAASYQRATGFPIITAARGWRPLVEAAFLAALLVPVGWFAVWRQLRAQPRDLLHPPPVPQPMAVERALARLPLGHAANLGLRNLVRRPAAALVTMVSAAGTLVMAGGMYLYADAQHASTDLYLKSRAWDALVQFTRPKSEDRTQALMDRAGVPSFEVFTSAEGRVRGASADREITVMGWPVNSRLQGDGWLLEGHGLQSPDADEILLTHRDLQEIGAALGEDVDVTIEGEVRRLRVVGVLHSYTLGQAYVGRATLDAFHEEPLEPAGAMVAADPKAVSALLRQKESGRVLRGDVIREVTAEGHAALIRIMHAYGHLGTLAALMLLFAAMRVRAAERESEYAVLLGYGITVPWIARGLVVEAFVLGLGAGILAVPGTQLATSFFQRRIAEVWMYIPMENDPLAASLVLLAPVAALPIAALVPALNLRKLDLVRALSTRQSA